MRPEDQYLKFVRWSDEDRLYVGHCPDLFPWGGACHAQSEEAAYGELCALVREEVEQLQSEGKPLPIPNTRPMREVATA